MSAGCASFARHLPPPEESLRGYEISKELDKFIYTYCAEETIFGNCKRMEMIEIKFSDKVAMKRLKDKGFVLKVRDSL